MNYVNGCDVSDFQTVTSFHAAQASGIGFAIAKATQGVGNVQDTFAGYRDRVRATGMVFGAYHFLEWDVDPAAQARHFLSVYTPANGDLPPVLDCEAVPAGMSSAACIAHVAGFLAVVEPRLKGQRALLYMSYSFPNDHLAGGADFAGHNLWIAAYEGHPAPTAADVTPPGWRGPGKVVKHQWSDGSGLAPVPGIGNVDRDVFLGDADQLRAYALRGL